MTGPALTRAPMSRSESEIAVLTGLCRRIDAHVTALNAARRELAERLTRLDAVVDACDEPHLQEVLRLRTAAPLPLEDEVFPERLYG